MSDILNKVAEANIEASESTLILKDKVFTAQTVVPPNESIRFHQPVSTNSITFNIIPPREYVKFPPVPDGSNIGELVIGIFKELLELDGVAEVLTKNNVEWKFEENN